MNVTVEAGLCLARIAHVEVKSMKAQPGGRGFFLLITKENAAGANFALVRISWYADYPFHPRLQPPWL